MTPNLAQGRVRVRSDRPSAKGRRKGVKMKSLLMSIQPKWCEKIANGEKTIEVRKSRPKLETPFKVYIYETQGENKTGTGIFAYGIELKGTKKGKGKVIGEFVCDRIDKYTAEFVNDGECYEDVRRVWVDDDGEEDFEIVTGNDRDNPEDCDLLKNSCLSYAELKRYIGENFHDIPFYAWHISQLKIYDNPKELSEFYKPFKYDNTCGGKVVHCGHYEGVGEVDFCAYNKGDCSLKGCKELRNLYRLKKPPRSWCYIQE